MGIKSLSTILNNFSKNSIKNVTLDNFKGKVISIDTSIYLYKFLYNNSDFIDGFTRQILRLLKNGITPLYIFDGKPPKEKKEVLNERKERKEYLLKKKTLLEGMLKGDMSGQDGMEKYMMNVVDMTPEEINKELKKVQKKIIYVTGDDIDKAKKLFEHFGIPYIDADGEAETYCAVLTKNGFTSGCITEDTDYLACGGNNFIRSFNSSTNNIVLYKIKEVLSDLELSYDQFIDMCILCGCDYTNKIVGIGAIKAYKFIKNFGTIEGVIESIKDKDSYKVPEDFDYITARRLLKCENTFDLSGVKKEEFKVKMTDEQMLINYIKFSSPTLKKKYYVEITKCLKKYKMGCLSNVSKKKNKDISSYFEKKKYFINENI
jgi:flap endonuclease-1